MISWASKVLALILFIYCVYLNMKMHVSFTHMMYITKCKKKQRNKQTTTCTHPKGKKNNWSSTLWRKLLHLSHWGGLKWRLQYHPRHPTNERRTSLLTSPFWNNEVKLFRGLSCEWFLQTVSNKWFGRLWLVNVKTFNDDSLLRIFVDDYLSVPLSLWVFWCL